jgi:hypothetical protein
MCSIEYRNWYGVVLHANTVEAYGAYWIQPSSKLTQSHGRNCQYSSVIALESLLVSTYCRVGKSQHTVKGVPLYMYMYIICYKVGSVHRFSWKVALVLNQSSLRWCGWFKISGHSCRNSESVQCLLWFTTESFA